MKKYIISAIICCSMVDTPCFAQQPLASSPVNRRDSLEILEEQLKNYRSVDPSKLTEKEVSQEIIAGKSDIFLDVKYRNVEIKTWNQPKVKVITKVLIEGKSALTDEQWFERLNLIVKVIGSRVQITSGVENASYFNSYSSAVTTYISGNSYNNSSLTVFNGEGNRVGAIETAKRTIIVFIPEGNKLEVENQSGNLQLGNLHTVSIKSTNGSIETGDINKLILRSKYTPVVVGNIKDAEIEIANGRLRAGNIENLDIDSKYTNVEIGTVNNIMLRSANDEYEIEDAGEIKGRKTYGNLRITNLTTAIDFEGANADIKVRNISPAVETININNKYADIRLPVNSIKNYEVRFSGRYNTVYAPFDKKPLNDTVKKDDPLADVTVIGRAGNGRITNRSLNNLQSVVSFNDASDSRGFTAEAGDIKGKHTRFVINCASCTVDFK